MLVSFAAKETGAIPYDIPGAEPFSHDGELCSFDAFIKHYKLTDPALDHLAVIVRGADTARPDLAPQAAGLHAISLGLSANTAQSMAQRAGFTRFRKLEVEHSVNAFYEIRP